MVSITYDIFYIVATYSDCLIGTVEAIFTGFVNYITD